MTGSQTVGLGEKEYEKDNGQGGVRCAASRNGGSNSIMRKEDEQRDQEDL